MNLTYEISNLARKDLEDIWKYTFENWSRSQADKYYRILVKEFDVICKNPEIGKSIDHVKPGHRIRSTESPLIVYKMQSEKIWIDRILHMRMDIESRLKE